MPPRNPAQPRPARSLQARQAAPPQAGPERRLRERRLGRGHRRLPALRHPPHCRPPLAARDPQAQRLSELPRGAPPARPRVLTRHQGRQEHDKHNHGSAAAVAAQGDAELTSRTPATTTARAVLRLPEVALSSPPRGRSPPSPPIPSYAAVCGRDVAWETSG